MDLCELQCYHEPNCVSINFKVIPDDEGLHECELNNATHQSYDGQLEDKDGYVYKGAEVKTLHLAIFIYSALTQIHTPSCAESCRSHV